MDGFLSLHKPAGFTSHDCVARVRRTLHQRRIGHGGTLDPMATGVLPIALGKATRLLQFLPPGKTYLATLRFGLTTSTDDITGTTLEDRDASHLTLATVQQALPAFQGTFLQIPPRYSAIQVEGQRLYDKARAGETFDIPQRQVEVTRLEILGWRPGPHADLDVAIDCGPGTYIRAIARDLGNTLGTGGTLASLIRTRSGGMTLEESLTLEDLENQTQPPQSFTPLPPAQLLQHLPLATLTGATAHRWCQGQPIPWEALVAPPLDQALTHGPTTPWLVRQGKTGQFLGIGLRMELPPGIFLKPQVVTASSTDLPQELS